MLTKTYTCEFVENKKVCGSLCVQIWFFRSALHAYELLNEVAGDRAILNFRRVV